MKRCILAAGLIFSISLLFAQQVNPKTGFPEIIDKPFAMFNEGASFAQNTRIQNMEKHNISDFVWQNYFIGAYIEVQTGNMKPFNSIGRVAVYYPFLHTFNGMEQIPKQVLLYDVDLFYGILFQTDMWKYVHLNFAVGPHFNYELSDEYHHIDLGLGLFLGAELPVSPRWTVLINGMASYDYGNLGSNANICDYNHVWLYQLELGFRYSRKGINTYSYIKPRKKKPAVKKAVTLEEGVSSDEEKESPEEGVSSTKEDVLFTKEGVSSTKEDVLFTKEDALPIEESILLTDENVSPKEEDIAEETELSAESAESSE